MERDEPVEQPVVPAKTITTKAVFDRSTTQTISVPDLANLESESGTAHEAGTAEAQESELRGGLPLKLVGIAAVLVAIGAFVIFGLGGGADEETTTATAAAETTSITPTESTAAAPIEVPTTAATEAPLSTTTEVPESTTTEVPESTTPDAPIALATTESTTTILETGAPFNCEENQGPVTPQLNVANIAADDPDGGLNIRDGVSVSATKLITVPNGTAFTHLGGCEIVANGDVWWEVYGEGITGWANAKYFTS